MTEAKKDKLNKELNFIICSFQSLIQVDSCQMSLKKFKKSFINQHKNKMELHIRNGNLQK
jgi:hypothetical protein